MPLGHLSRVENKSRKFGADSSYVHVEVYLPEKDEVSHLLLTEHEFQRALNRAAANPEDFPQETGVVSRIFDWLKGK